MGASPLLLDGLAAAGDGGPGPAAGPPPPSRPARRWRDLAVVAVAVALVAGGLVLSGPGGDDPGAAESATSTSVPREPRRRLGNPGSPATTLHFGPLLPEPTGTTVMLLGNARAHVVDVDTGTVSEERLGTVGGNLWSAEAVGSSIVVQGGQRSLFALRPPFDAAPVELGRGDEVLVGPGGDTVWTALVGRDTVELREVGLDGTPTGRERTFPPAFHPVAALEGGFVVTAPGLTLFAPHEGPPRRLPDGRVLGVAGDAVVRLACGEDLRCRLHLTDVATGDDRVVFEGEGLPWAEATVSPDGGALVLTRSEGLAILLVDLRPGTATELDVGLVRAPEPAWSPDGRWVFFASTDGMVAVSRDGEVTALDLGGMPGVERIVTL